MSEEKSLSLSMALQWSAAIIGTLVLAFSAWAATSLSELKSNDSARATQLAVVQRDLAALKESVSAGTADRYTVTEARADRTAILAQIERVKAEVEKAVYQIDLRVTTLESKERPASQ
jgi:hypothetical protein